MTFRNVRTLTFQSICWAKGKELFDEIIHIKPDEEKTDYIEANENDLFIDDSFSERSKMQKKYGLYAFSVDMLEVLLDWRM